MEKLLTQKAEYPYSNIHCQYPLINVTKNRNWYVICRIK